MYFPKALAFVQFEIRLEINALTSWTFDHIKTQQTWFKIFSIYLKHHIYSSLISACINEPFSLIGVRRVSIIVVVITLTPDEYDVRRCVGSL